MDTETNTEEGGHTTFGVYPSVCITDSHTSLLGECPWLSALQVLYTL